MLILVVLEWLFFRSYEGKWLGTTPDASTRPSVHHARVSPSLSKRLSSLSRTKANGHREMASSIERDPVRSGLTTRHIDNCYLRTGCTGKTWKCDLFTINCRTGVWKVFVLNYVCGLICCLWLFLDIFILPTFVSSFVNSGEDGTTLLKTMFISSYYYYYCYENKNKHTRNRL